MDPETAPDLTPAPLPEEAAPAVTEVAPEEVTVSEPEAPAPDESTPADVPTGDEDPVISPDELVGRIPADPALQVNGSLPLAAALVINR